MLTPGSKLGDTDDTCYIGVFGHGRLERDADSIEKSVVVLGNIFMEKYYVVYDMSSLTSSGVLQIGIAPVATDIASYGIE